MLTIFACSLAAGAVDDTSDRVNTALLIFGIGLLFLIVHGVLFIYRSVKKQRKSGWVFWVVLAFSILIIPLTLFMVAMSAGTACGFGSSYGPTFLLVFELVGLAAQIVSWRYLNRPAPSPIPQD